MKTTRLNNTAWLALLLTFSAPVWAAEQSNPSVRSVTYTAADAAVPLQLDLYIPKSSVAVPVVLLIHGGGWFAGSRSDSYIVAACRALAARGIAAAAISYRLVPKAHYPAPLQDVTAALNWLKANGVAEGLNTEQVALWGYSAGAHLASLASMQPQPLNIAAVVAGGTPADLRVWPNSSMVVNFMASSLASDAEHWAEASPVARVTAQTPPHFLYHGRLDMLVPYSQGLALRDALSAAGVRVTLQTRWFYGHIATALLPGSSTDAAIDFLQARWRELAVPAAGKPLS